MITASAAVAATIFLIIFNSVVVGGVVYGYARDLEDLFGGHLTISSKNGFLERPDDQMIGYLMSHSDVVGAAPRTFRSLDINHTSSGQTHSLFRIQALGVDPMRELSASLLYTSVIEGAFLRGEGAVVIDDSIAERLSAEVGSYVTVGTVGPDGLEVSRRLLVAGIFKVFGPIGFSDTVIMHQNDLKEMTGLEQKYSGNIMVRLRDSQRASSVKRWIEASYSQDDWLRVETVDEYGRVGITAYREGIGFVTILSFSGLVASGLGVITILMMMVNSKVREIGILRALGMTGRQILLIFMMDGAMLGILGATMGAVTGSAISLYMANNPVALFSGLVPDIRFSLDALPVPMFVGFTMSVVASIYPALRAARFQPEEAMRYV